MSEDAERAIHEDALSVQVRSGWYMPGDHDADKRQPNMKSCFAPEARRAGSWASSRSTASLRRRAWRCRTGSSRGLDVPAAV